MAVSTFNASSGVWPATTQAVTTSADYILHNSSKATIVATLSHSNAAVGTVTVELGPDEHHAMRFSTAGTVTFSGVPGHTVVNAQVPIELDNRLEETAGYLQSAARLGFGPF